MRRPGATDAARVERLTPALALIGEINTQIPRNQVIVEDSPFARRSLLVATRTPAAGFVPEAFIAAFDPDTGIETWRPPNVLGGITPNSMSYVQLDNETTSELAFATAMGMYLTQ